jgi:16S rRNA G527 N7-methylase RsmG
VTRVGDAALASYVELLRKYHGTLALVSDRALAGIDGLLRDGDAYADAVRELAPEGVVLDLGTGAGLPAVVIAARLPERSMLWVERRQRRAVFLRTVAAACGFRAVSVAATDVRSLDAGALTAPLAVVTAQAVAGWRSLHDWTRHLHAGDTLFVARRGGDWQEEAAAFAESMPVPVAVLRAEPLGRGGTLVAIRVGGGGVCR